MTWTNWTAAVMLTAQDFDADIKLRVNNETADIETIHYDVDLGCYLIDAGTIHPELWGVTTAAAYLGVTRQRIDQLRQAYPTELAPVVKLPGKLGPYVWLAETWRQFALRDRHPGRRTT